ncbi:hypothetical protein IW261DRAFT_1517503 [Armillaria novae-zelandiae]|uniref:Uncharacterized protein n=1 Tax=Armillaria novae-zelandiae TaxID=153914 RepID=A0AA39T6Y0_9AGAR|nr:hypothetical protein IW261DRAFT_1517503 [Armillaria novae-zelandiae]
MDMETAAEAEAHRDMHRKTNKKDDNFHFVNSPTEDALYPYNKNAKAGPPPPSPSNHPLQFTDATYPRIHISFRKLIEDLSPGQKSVLQRESEAYIVVIPFGAGPKIYQLYTTLKQDVKAFLDVLDIEKGSFKISIPKMEWKATKIRDYQSPWPFFIENASQPLRKFLLWQQTFPISDKLVLNFLAVDPSKQSWVIATYRSHFVENDKDIMADVLRRIKKTTCKSTKIVGMVNTIRTGQGFRGHAVTACEEMTHTWRLGYILTLQNNNKIGVWQLMGKPITGEEVPHQNLLKADGKARLECVWYKSEMHQSHACPFPEVSPNWRGPTKDEMSATSRKVTVLEEKEADTSQKGYRHSGRGGRRGNTMTQGGFQTVRGKGRK